TRHHQLGADQHERQQPPAVVDCQIREHNSGFHKVSFAFITMSLARLAPLPAAATFPRKRGKDSCLSLCAFPSPAKRGKVPKADGGAPRPAVSVRCQINRNSPTKSHSPPAP